MKRLLLPLLAALAIPAAVNSEVSTIIFWEWQQKKSYVVPMQSLEVYEVPGQKFVDAKAWFRRQETMTPLTYICVSNLQVDI